jgi:hypothetical protein
MYIDMTSEQLYTLSDEAIELLDKSFIDIMAKRVELNEELPLANHEIAGDNIGTADKNLSVAEAAVKTAEKNVELAKLGKLAFARSVVKARSNYQVADTNYELAKAIAELAAQNAGRAEGETVSADKMTDEEKIAAANLKIAEENFKTATENLRIAAENEKTSIENIEIEKYNKQNAYKEGDEGYKAPLPYKELGEYKPFEDISAYADSYGIDFGIHSAYENLTVAENNLTASRALVSDANGKIAASSITSTVLGYLSGAKSNIQTQIDNISSGAVSCSQFTVKAVAGSGANTSINNTNSVFRITIGTRNFLCGVLKLNWKNIYMTAGWQEWGLQLNFNMNHNTCVIGNISNVDIPFTPVIGYRGKVITITHNGMSSKSNSTMDLTLPMIPITSWS